MKAGLAAGLAAFLSASPAASQGIPDHPRKLRFPERRFELPPAASLRTPLPGGAVLYLVEDPALPLVEVAAALRVGVFLDPPGRAGTARLAGAMLRRGGTRSLAPEAFDRAVDRLGARLAAGVGETRGGASLSATSWTLDEALTLLFDMLARPRFDAERLEIARRNLVESLERRNDDPLDVLEREWQWLLFGRDHATTRPPTPGSVGDVTRDELLAFHRRHFRREGLVLAVSGDVRRDELVPRLERHLTRWPEAPPPEGDGGWPPAAPRHRPRPGLYLARADTPQVKVLLGHRSGAGDWSDRERVALGLMNEILGGTDAVSRIPGRLRAAEGLVYRADAHFDTGRPWPADFRVFFEAEAGKVPSAVALVRDEIQRLRERPPHPKELEVTRRAALSSLRLAFDTAEKLAGWYAQDELLGRPSGHWERRYRLLTQIGGEEIRRTAQRWLRPERLVVLVVGRAEELLGPRKGESELERAVGAEAVVLPRRDPSSLAPLRER